MDRSIARRGLAAGAVVGVSAELVPRSAPPTAQRPRGRGRAPGRGLAPGRPAPRPARRVAAGRPRSCCSRSWRSAAIRSSRVPRQLLAVASCRAVAGGDVGARRDPAVRVGDRVMGGLGRRGDARRRGARADRRSRAGDGDLALRIPAGSLPVVRGCDRALPLALILVVVLFASADPIFRAPSPTCWASGSTWASAFPGADPLRAARLVPGGRPGWSRSRRRDPEPGALVARRGGPDRCPVPRHWVLGPARGARHPRVVDLVVGLFVGLQVAYLFGGVDTLVAAGMTYGDHARRGFFELVAAACLAGGSWSCSRRPSSRRSRAYLAGARRARGADRARPGLGALPPPALPGRLRLDRAAALCPGDDRARWMAASS